MEKLILTDPETDLRCLQQLEKYALFSEMFRDPTFIQCMENADRTMNKIILEVFEDHYYDNRPEVTGSIEEDL